MASNNNIFYATNPARMTDALGIILGAGARDLSDVLLFLPSRRAVRSVEKMLVRRAGHAVILPQMVPLGDAPDLADDDCYDDDANVVSDMRRVITLCRLLAADGCVGTVANALPLARDLLRMTDYLENEGISIADVDWDNIVDERFAAHFQHKADILHILGRVMPEMFPGMVTRTAQRNADIRKWIRVLDVRGAQKYRMIIVCASTASVPATADLMAHIAKLDNGRIILSGKIAGRESDMMLPMHPYNSEYKFLTRIGVRPDDVIPIDVGASAIDFMNVAFGNDFNAHADAGAIAHCRLIECPREATEAAAVAEIVARARADNKSVLVITPDAAGGQRIAAAFDARGIVADFSGGVSGASHPIGRAILNMLDEWNERGGNDFAHAFRAAGNNLFCMISDMVDGHKFNFAPDIDLSDENATQIFVALRELSDAIKEAGLDMDVASARALCADALSNVSIRAAMNDAADVVVLGTIESRMQTADVVILTGLNDGMFPARGYENAWLPRAVAEKIGLPSPDRKVSLMALDFMNLSCGECVYWTRSCTSGGTQTTESRFISRVVARARQIMSADDVLRAVYDADAPSPRPLNRAPFAPPADWSDVYVTELEKLIHNPYAFYVSHILRLKPRDDYWIGPDARTFGNLVHDVIANANPATVTPDALVREMDARARTVLGRDDVLFRFWHKRFMEIAPIIANELTAFTDAKSEIAGHITIAGRRVRARADRVWPGGVMDIKTGAAPSKKQLLDGNMPQLPLEAMMLQSGGFAVRCTAQTPVMRFLQLRNNDVRVIEYDGETASQMINAAVAKTTELFNMYSAGAAAYEYRETGDAKYRAYDDLARVHD